MSLTADGFPIVDGMTVWLDGWLAPLLWGVVEVTDEGLQVCFGGNVVWEVFPCDLYATEAAAIAAMQKGGVSCH